MHLSTKSKALASSTMLFKKIKVVVIFCHTWLRQNFFVANIPLKLKMKYPANITGDVSNFISNVILHVKKTNLNPLEEPKKIM